MHRIAAFIVAMFIFVPGLASEGGWPTRSGYYTVSFESELEPIVINRIHSWIFSVSTPDGAPVSGAKITLTGGMPEHNHGLPTAPKLTAEIGAGRYRVEGLRFHMNGAWLINVTIDVDGRRDTVVIPLTI